MRTLLKRFLVFMDSNHRGLFWGCWFFLISPVFSRYLLKEFKTPSDHGLSPREGISMIVLLIVSVWGWRMLWKILQREGLRPIKDAVITLGGFLLIHLILFLPSIAVAVILGLLLPKIIAGIIIPIFMILIPFVSGCWIGFKRDQAVLIWCLAGISLSWLFVNITISGEIDLPWHNYFLYAIPVIMGGFFARTQLYEDENATDLSQISYQQPE
jgi:hypothetical protein